MAQENVIFDIVVGTYEKFLLGYHVKLDSGKNNFSIVPSFSIEAHLQSVRSIASSDKYLASGSSDETIQLFNIKSKQEIGSLLKHNGTILSLEFYDSYLMSCSEDGTICIFSVTDWECLKTLQGHKAAVNDISIHPSGKMALSVSNDKTLRTWNLIKGRSAYVTNIKKQADIVKWSPDGKIFITVQSKILNVYSIEKAGILHTYDFGKKICSVDFITDSILVIGGENDHLLFYNVSEGNVINAFKAHSSRIKSIKCATLYEDKFLFTVSSDGYIKVWLLKITQNNLKPELIVETKTTWRPTCLTVIPNNNS